MTGSTAGRTTGRSSPPVMKDFALSSVEPLDVWLARHERDHGLVPEDEPFLAVDELGLSVLRFAMLHRG